MLDVIQKQMNLKPKLMMFYEQHKLASKILNRVWYG